MYVCRYVAWLGIYILGYINDYIHNLNLKLLLCIAFYFLGNEVPIINIIARNSHLPTNEGYVSFL